MATVSLVAADADDHSAVGSRIHFFRRGLAQRGWRVTLIDPHIPHSTPVERMLEHAPARLRSALEGFGIEGDVRAATGWRSRHALRRVRSDVVVVSVPPFSLLGAAALALDRTVPLVVDYRDPWSARHHPPPIARAARAIERRAARRAAAVMFAGGAALGDLLIRHLGLPPHCVVSVPNGIPVIAVCPSDAALLQLPGAQRFHHVHHRDLDGLATLLRLASQDRATLRIGRLGESPTRDLGVETLHSTLLSAIKGT